MGLDVDTYRFLCEHTSELYHNGANVNFLYSYEMLKPENVDATGEVIRMACTGVRKTIQYVSSLAVYGSLNKKRIVDERSDLNDARTVQFGYNQSKWVADSMLQKARAAGIPCNVYRIASAAGDTQHGCCQVKDFFWLMLQLGVRMKKMPEFRNQILTFISVDLIAKAVIALATAGLRGQGENFNIYDANAPYHVVKGMQEYGYEIQLLPYQQWYQCYRQAAEQHEDLQEFGNLPELISGDVLLPDESSLLSIRSEVTEARLRELGVDLHAMTKEELFTQLGYFEETGFFARPR